MEEEEEEEEEGEEGEEEEKEEEEGEEEIGREEGEEEVCDGSETEESAAFNCECANAWRFAMEPGILEALLWSFGKALPQTEPPDANALILDSAKEAKPIPPTPTFDISWCCETPC